MGWELLLSVSLLREGHHCSTSYGTYASPKSPKSLKRGQLTTEQSVCSPTCSSGGVLRLDAMGVKEKPADERRRHCKLSEVTHYRYTRGNKLCLIANVDFSTSSLDLRHLHCWRVANECECKSSRFWIGDPGCHVGTSASRSIRLMGNQYTYKAYNRCYPAADSLVTPLAGYDWSSGNKNKTSHKKNKLPSGFCFVSSLLKSSYEYCVRVPPLNKFRLVSPCLRRPNITVLLRKCRTCRHLGVTFSYSSRYARTSGPLKIR